MHLRILVVLTLIATNLLGFAPRAGAQVDEPRLVVSGSSTSGFLLEGGTRQWVNDACRAELEDAGHIFERIRWAEYGSLPVATDKRSCADIGVLVSLPPVPTPTSRLVTTGSSTSGFLLEGGTRQWVNDACRAELEDAGHIFERIAWAEYGSLPVASDKRACSDIDAVVESPPPADGPRFASIVEVDLRLFLVTANEVSGERQNVEACRADLSLAGIDAVFETWTWLGRFPARTDRLSCAEVIVASQRPSVPRLVNRLVPAGTDVTGAAMSADGNIVAFTTASRIVADDYDNDVDVHIIDRAAGTTKRVGAGTGQDTGSRLALSGDGAWVFYVGVDPLVTTHTLLAVLAVRTETGQVNPLAQLRFTANPNFVTSLSTDHVGSAVAIITSRDLESGDRNQFEDAYLVDRTTRTLTLISSDSAGNAGNAETRNAELSGDGEWVAITSDASNLAGSSQNLPPSAYLYHVPSGVLSPLDIPADFEAANRRTVTISDDGSILGYSQSNSPYRVVSSFEGVLANLDGDIERSPLRPASISGDGRWLVATDLPAGGRATLVDLFTGDEYEIGRDFGARSRGSGGWELSQDGSLLLVRTYTGWVDTESEFVNKLFIFDLTAPTSPLAGR